MKHFSSINYDDETSCVLLISVILYIESILMNYTTLISIHLTQNAYDFEL